VVARWQWHQVPFIDPHKRGARVDVANPTLYLSRLRGVAAAAAERADLLFPAQGLAAGGSCTIGGNRHNNAGGTQVPQRATCVQSGSGHRARRHLARAERSAKDNTGYDLSDLFITAKARWGNTPPPRLPAHPQPLVCLTAWAAPFSLDAAQWRCWASQWHLGAGPTGFEVINNLRSACVTSTFPPLRTAVAGQAQLRFFAETATASLKNMPSSSACWRPRLRSPERRGGGRESGAARSPWHIRESISAGAGPGRAQHQARHCIAVSRIPPSPRSTLCWRETPGVRLVNFNISAMATCTTTCRRCNAVDAARPSAHPRRRCQPVGV
jgi:hypothetical protein